MKESEITKSILNELKEMGIFVWKHWSGAFSKKGISDILGILPGSGRFLAIEVKTNNGKLSGYQREFLGDILKNGGLAFVARSLKDVRVELQKVGFKPPQERLF